MVKLMNIGQGIDWLRQALEILFVTQLKVISLVKQIDFRKLLARYLVIEQVVRYFRTYGTAGTND